MPVSAKENKGISELLENILLVAEMQELKADPNRAATGVVIEAELDKSRGPVATVLVHNGTLRTGDVAVAGPYWGRVKAMFNDAGKQVRRAGPATPVAVLGLSGVPAAGELFSVVPGEPQAKTMVEKRKSEQAAAARSVNLSTIYEQISAGKVKELPVVLKTDVQGSIEPIRTSLEQLSNDEVKVRVIHTGTGGITENDVMLAAASKGIVIGFSVDADQGAKREAEVEGISVRRYDVIYSLVDDVSKALKGMLAPVKEEVVEGRAEVRAVFPAAKGTKVAGVWVAEGKITRGSSVRVLRGNKVLAESTVASLRRFKDDVREVAAGYEAGVVVKDHNDFEVGDVLVFFRIEQRV